MIKISFILTVFIYISCITVYYTNTDGFADVLMVKSIFGCDHLKAPDKTYVHINYICRDCEEETENVCTEEKEKYYYLETKFNPEKYFKILTLTKNACDNICRKNQTKEIIGEKISMKQGYYSRWLKNGSDEEKIQQSECVRKEAEEKMFDLMDIEYLSSCVISGDSFPGECTPFWKLWNKDRCACAYRIKTKMPGRKIESNIINLLEGKCSSKNLGKLKKY